MTHDYDAALSAIAAYEQGPYTASDVFMEVHLETIKHALFEMQTLTAQNKLLAEAVVALNGSIVLLRRPNIPTRNQEVYAHAIQLATQITGEQS